MEEVDRSRPWALALLVALIYLVPALAVLDDFGPTWDHVQGEYPYGERLLAYIETGDPAFLDLRRHEPEPRVREPHLDLSQRRFPAYFVYTVGALSSALSCRLLWTELGLVPPMSAHHLPAPLFGALLVFVVTYFAARRIGTLGALVAGLSLACAPVFFGHAMSNIKDTPECCLYTLAVLAGLRALERDRARAWIPAGILVGLALAQKPNALFLPVQLALFLALCAVRLPSAERPRLRWSALGWTTLGFLAAWYGASPAFWREPIDAPLRWITWMLESGSYSFRPGMESRALRISTHAPSTVLATMTLATLALAACGAWFGRHERKLHAFLLLGMLLPIARNALPGMRNFGGVRHFLEFLPMACLLAGLGAEGLWRRLAARSPRAIVARVGAGVLLVLALIEGTVASIAMHPSQTLYYNALSGGLGGVQARGLQDARDAWCHSYWSGLRWLSAHAERGAGVIVPHGDFVAAAAAPLVLRPDLWLWTPQDQELPGPWYVMALAGYEVRDTIRALASYGAPVYTLRAQDGELLHIHRLDADEPGWYREHWLPEQADREGRRRVLAWLRSEPDKFIEVIRVFARDRDGALEHLRPLFPHELQTDLESALRLTLATSSEGDF